MLWVVLGDGSCVLILLTDSGGAGVMEECANKLKAAGIAINGVIVVPCTIHALQMLLANGVEKWMGEGELGTRNMIQMLFTAYSLQEYMSKEDWRDYIERAALWVNTQLSGKGTPDKDEQFQKDFDEIKSWRTDWSIPELGDDGKPIISLWKPPDEKKKKKNSDESNKDQGEASDKKRTGKKIPKPVLTRWQYVGGSAECVLYSYLVIFRICQLVIRLGPKGPSSLVNIASELKSLMSEIVIFCDLVFITCFHDHFFKAHLDWLMQSRDLTKPAFQAHQILVRFHLIDSDLKRMMKDDCEDLPEFASYVYALSRI